MIYVMSGLPGSGKTHYSSELGEQYGYKVYHFDEWKQKYCSSTMKTLEIYNNMMQSIIEDLKQDKTIVLDDLNLDKSFRLRLLQLIKDIPTQKVCIVMLTPLDKCMERDSQRIHALPPSLMHQLAMTFQLPTLDEGWDDIIFIKE